MNRVLLSTEKLGDFGPSELFCINGVSDHKVRKAGVLFKYTELEMIDHRILIEEYMTKFLSASHQLRYIVFMSVVNHKKQRMLIATNKPKNIFNTLMGLYESLPYYIQPGFEEITSYGFRLDNGLEINIG